MKTGIKTIPEHDKSKTVKETEEWGYSGNVYILFLSQFILNTWVQSEKAEVTTTPSISVCSFSRVRWETVSTSYCFPEMRGVVNL